MQTPTLQLIVKFSNSRIPDLAIDVPDPLHFTIPQIRRVIRDRAGGVAANHRLRLIALGHVLNERSDFVRDVTRFSHEELAALQAAAETGDDAGVGTSASTGTSTTTQPKRVYILCSIGEVMSPEQLLSENSAETEQQPTRSTEPEVLGFDRLRGENYTARDIAQLRRQFAARYGAADNSDDEETRALAEQGAPVPVPAGGGAAAGGAGVGAQNSTMVQLEEQWLNSTEPAPLGGEDYLDDLVGLLLGMFLGVFALLVLKERGVLSPRRRRSLVGGAAVNVAFAVIRLFC